MAHNGCSAFTEGCVYKHSLARVFNPSFDGRGSKKEKKSRSTNHIFPKGIDPARHALTRHRRRRIRLPCHRRALPCGRGPRRRFRSRITFTRRRTTLRHKAHATVATKYMETPELADLDWENLGFNPVEADFMYKAKCGADGDFSRGEIVPFEPIPLSPFAAVLNYGQSCFEGLKAYRKADGSLLLFRPEENAVRIIDGGDRICMPAPTVEQFLDAVKQTVLANKRWVPPTGKGSLYIRPLLFGSGAVLGLAPPTEYTFLIYVSPVGNYFKEGLAPINLIVEHNFHRAVPGGTGGVKTIGNYASVLKAQTIAKENGYSDVLYLDAIHNKYLEEVSSCNIFIVKGNTISTPPIEGTILPGITRKSIIELAKSKGYEVEERPVSVDESLDADEVFCTGTAVVVSPVGSITYLGKRVEYGGNQGVGVVSQQLYTSLTSLQTGHAEDLMGWTMQLN